jgi:hypothetical protein
MDRPTGILSLSNELLKDILDYVDPDPEKIIPVDRRAYLSVESFKTPSPPPPSQARDVGNFRYVCKRFAQLGIPHQFTRLTTRFSKAGFTRLKDISEREHLAKHVRKFSYMIPFFYVEGWLCGILILGVFSNRLFQDVTTLQNSCAIPAGALKMSRILRRRLNIKRT